MYTCEASLYTRLSCECASALVNLYNTSQCRTWMSHEVMDTLFLEKDDLNITRSLDDLGKDPGWGLTVFSKQFAQSYRSLLLSIQILL